ncbi:MAG TPA: hypothetical protein VE172_23670, partial [Stackebrandtia sp.]|uniref:ATP-binding protein n=1 Tax=Stackebrandtia sp. TaxID=2023065 RepID=UPI002D24B9FD
PAALTSFIGRDADLAALRGAFAAGRLVTVTGPGGAGKTRTALRLADDLSSDMDARMVELAPVSTEPEVVSAFLTALGMSDTLPRSRGGVMASALTPAEQILVTLRDKRMLLLVDNCEHVLDAAAGLVARVLAGCPGVRVVATSREPLGVTGETVYPLASLPYPGADATVDEALGYPAVRLLAERGAAARHDFAVTADNRDAVIEICRRLDGLPLAIELAAARLRGIAPAALAERLGERFRLLTGGDRTALPRHRTLRAVVDWSWDLLDAKERLLLARLSVFAGGAALDSVEAVCGCGGDVVEPLASLVDKSLVVLGEDGRYRLLETIREYGAEKLADSGHTDATRRAHAAHFLRLAETAEPKLRTAEQITWMRRLEAENDNLMAAIHIAVADGDADTAQGIVASACLFWWLRGRRVEGGAAATTALAVPGRARPLYAALARLAYALHAFDTEPDLDSVTGALREACEIRDAHGLADQHALLRLLDVILSLIAQRDAVMLRDIMGNLRDPDPWLRATAHAMHAAIWVNHGRVARAESYLRTALGLYEEVGERWGQCLAHAELSEIVAWSGRLDEAKYHFETALRTEQELGVDPGRSEVRGRLSYYRFLVDDPAATRRNLEFDLQAARRVGAADNEAFAHLMLAFHHEREGNSDTARVHLRECMTLADRYKGPPHMQAMVATVETRLDLRDNQVEAAERRLRTAIRYAVLTLDGPIIAQALEAAADIALARHDPREAARLLGRAELVRGVRDECSPTVADTEKVARKALGDKEFDERYAEGRHSSRRRLLLSYGASMDPRRPGRPARVPRE